MKRLSDEDICDKAKMRVPTKVEIFLQTPTAYLGITELRAVARKAEQEILRQIKHGIYDIEFESDAAVEFMNGVLDFLKKEMGDNGANLT